ncbi:uracil-DNA glycosylase [Paenibacillus glycanilyticus]|uniref:Uracil-DNA glycosylase n=1 Tax=Paenibacillus glycanilyticus TaxID=126569 RepID=A0ABQ6GDX7_9BACL|nr:uracil-DNA glycosylase [Paenibacillus glycanilyticus]GLX68305.1 uracil-DNA glycosylase [Paenibacillus glycanilyticus]
MDFKLTNDWARLLRPEMDEPYFKRMEGQLDEYYRTTTVYPKVEHIFNALQYTPYGETKVVILGQDPYHGPGQAHGLSFSVREGVAIPPSLRNIYKELQEDIGCPVPRHGSLVTWAKQGVLLLNTVLTVEEGQANSHQKLGWERFTSRIIQSLNDRDRPVVFLLWGKHAQDKAAFIDADKHPVIASAHPSPLAARKGFFGSRPFSKVNEHLRRLGSEEINWLLPEQPEED